MNAMRLCFVVVMLSLMLGCATQQEANICNGPGAQQNRMQSERFFAANGNKDGVISSESGLQYKIIHAGYGKVRPGPINTVIVHYETRRLDGTVIDSSFARGQPIRFMPNQVIIGWTLSLYQMVEGEIRTVYVPYSLAYGCRAQPPRIGYDESLVFDIELIKVL